MTVSMKLTEEVSEFAAYMAKTGRFGNTADGPLSGLPSRAMITASWPRTSPTGSTRPGLPQTKEIPESHHEDLDRRLAAADADPTAGRPWEEGRARPRGKKCPTP